MVLQYFVTVSDTGNKIPVEIDKSTADDLSATKENWQTDWTSEMCIRDRGDMRDMEHQRQIIDTFVNSVYVFDDRVVLNFNFTDDSKTISREEVLGSSAVENAPPQKSQVV